MLTPEELINVLKFESSISKRETCFGDLKLNAKCLEKYIVYAKQQPELPRRQDVIYEIGNLIEAYTDKVERQFQHNNL